MTLVFGLRKIAIYLLDASGCAGFSFLILVPFAVGLLWARRWAVWGTGALGILAATMVIGIALVGSVSGMTGLTVGFGTVVLTHPTAFDLWAFALVYLGSSESR